LRIGSPRRATLDGSRSVGRATLTQTDMRSSRLRKIYHPVGACRLGAVVDSGLRVNGVPGLRVVDASVLPGIPQAMVNAATIAVAEKASDLVLAG
jgi:choline dehydrogenase-like flavoprotein